LFRNNPPAHQPGTPWYIGTVVVMCILVLGIDPLYCKCLDCLPNYIYSSNLVKQFWCDNASGDIRLSAPELKSFPIRNLIFNTSAHDIKQTNGPAKSEPLVFSREGTILYHRTKTIVYAMTTTVKKAMGLSGAAISPNMGTAFQLNVGLKWAFSMLSVNLGKWKQFEPQNHFYEESRFNFLRCCVRWICTVIGTLPFILFVVAGTLQIAIRDFTTQEMYLCIAAIIILAVLCALSLHSFDKIDNYLLYSPFYRILKSLTLSDVSAEAPVKKIADGGHLDNLGLFPLIFQRRIPRVVALDAGRDTEDTLNDLLESLRLIEEYCDLQDEVFRFLPDDPSNVRTDETGFAKQSYLVVRWKIKPKNPGPGKKTYYGKIIYLRSVMIREFNARIHLHKYASPEFPYKPTSDPRYSRYDFQCYFEMGKELFNHNLPAIRELLESFSDKSRWLRQTTNAL